MDEDEWLRRYRTRFAARKPEFTPAQLDQLAGRDSFFELAPDYPDSPEQAVDDEIDENQIWLDAADLCGIRVCA